MKTRILLPVSVLTCLLLTLLTLTTTTCLAVPGVRLSTQGNNILLRWTSETNQTFVIGFRPTLNPSDSWTLLSTAVPAAQGNETSFTHVNGFSGASTGFYFVSEYGEDPDADGVPNNCELLIGSNLLKADTDGDGQSDGEEDADGDGLANSAECLLGGDPLTPDNEPLITLADGLVLSGQFDVFFVPDPNYANILGPMLDADGVTANNLVTTEPSAGHLRLRWHSVFVQYDAGFRPAGGDPDPLAALTTAERNALRDAFGQGTDMDVGRISKPNQAKVDQLPEHVLDAYKEVATKQLRKEFIRIQQVNTGAIQPPPGISLQRYMKIRMNQIHTQFTRLTSVTKSLAQRFGRLVNRVLPFVGGILFIASANAVAEAFHAAMSDYASDIANGDSETGSAAIMSGQCNDLAPGAGNIVLNYLLR